MIPTWVHAIAILSLLFGFAAAIAIAIDVTRHPQHMKIMNIVWPVTALFGSVLALWGYFRYGRLATHKMTMPALQSGSQQPNHTQTPFFAIVGKGAAHCGAGCTLGDIIAEWLAYFFPSVAILFGWQSLFAESMFAIWIVDFIFAFLLGIVFQYFAIVPIRDLSFGQGIVAALKADTLSLISWQIGMYGFMAFAQFYLFRYLLGLKLEPDSAEFWFMMQLAMMAGFATSYPVNWWLIKVGIKERM